MHTESPIRETLSHFGHEEFSHASFTPISLSSSSDMPSLHITFHITIPPICRSQTSAKKWATALKCSALIGGLLLGVWEILLIPKIPRIPRRNKIIGSWGDRRRGRRRAVRAAGPRSSLWIVGRSLDRGRSWEIICVGSWDRGRSWEIIGVGEAAPCGAARRGVP